MRDFIKSKNSRITKSKINNYHKSKLLITLALILLIGLFLELLFQFSHEKKNTKPPSLESSKNIRSKKVKIDILDQGRSSDKYAADERNVVTSDFCKKLTKQIVKVNTK